MKSAVLSFMPYIVIADVTVELPLLSMTTKMCFGPFNSREKAEEWAGEVERLHKDKERKESELAGAILGKTGLPTGAFVRTQMWIFDITVADKEAREPGNLIPAQAPEVDARDMHMYALKALLMGATWTLEHLEQVGRGEI